MNRASKLFPFASGLARVVAIATVFGFQLFSVAPMARASDLVVIVHKSNRTTKLDISLVRQIFAGDLKRWSLGNRIVPILPEDDSKAMRVMVEKVFGFTSVDELAQYYMAAIFQQKIAAPPESLTEAAAVARVAGDQGAVAIVRKGVATTADVKVIEVSGL